MNKRNKYFIEMTIGFIAYGLGIAGLNFLYDANGSSNYWLILLPVIPILFLVTVILRYLSQLDEMFRKMISEALAFSALATGFTCFSYLFLRDMGAPEFKAEWAFFIMWVYYGIGMMWSRRRY